MPLYEYTCRTCEERFEVLQKMGADSGGVSCPECGGTRLERQYSTFAGGAGPQMMASPEACPCGSPVRCGN